ncbi:SEC-C metal-binding domain-containing protein [Paenibacillus sp. BSR1-1]|uniref:SEC-C metal-binding domain-containing protein n=1 Tax=Paenibacillus sp. BSR1-1 TaxID=3020845 RepID=UPI0025AF3E34|nr:SEC-C metal-binding domain-containing protein [Paenibacillus sp. BSR1-1]MDN3019039.1 SEC-C metal-binding domain-containing protein [Paenibacillus sp. BSR1-1]
MEKINRNDPCPCGSGKKYKKCCGANEAISISQILEGEIDDLQKQLIHFAVYHYGRDIQEDFEAFETFTDIDNEQELHFYELIHTIWFSLFEELEDGETIIKKFIASETGKMKRPKLKQILQTWTNARAIAGQVITLENNKMTIEDGFTGEQMDAVVTGMPVTIEEGSFFVGILMPYEQNYVFFPSPFDLPEIEPEHAFQYIKDGSKDEDYDSPQEYLTDFFMEILSELPMIGGLLDIDEMDWPAPIYKEVADIFKNRLDAFGVPTPIVDTGVILWLNFCLKKQKRIQNPYLYAAALHYLLSTIAPMEKVFTQKELAELYEVSPGGISSIYSELESALSSEITELMGLVFNDGEDPPFEEATVIEFPKSRSINVVESNVLTLPSAEKAAKKGKSPSKKISRSAQERARNMIYDAMQTEGKHRYKLAEEALKLNPDCADAYVILAEKTKSLEEAILLYEKGIQAGERELGKAFFKENSGYFWGLVETRPFMRAKLHYAESLSLLGKIPEAATQYEELLELNPMDNQGVRYSLFVAYIDLGEMNKARVLLEQYEEESAQYYYNKLLLELHNNGFTANAAKLLKAAKKENKHVISYLTGRKLLPAYTPEFYGFGDENEAIVYADMHLHLWRKIEGLKEWLKSIK